MLMGIPPKAKFKASHAFLRKYLLIDRPEEDVHLSIPVTHGPVFKGLIPAADDQASRLPMAKAFDGRYVLIEAVITYDPSSDEVVAVRRHPLGETDLNSKHTSCSSATSRSPRNRRVACTCRPRSLRVPTSAKSTTSSTCGASSMRRGVSPTSGQHPFLRRQTPSATHWTRSTAF